MSVHTNPRSPLTVLAIALFLAGCGGSDNPATNTAEITANDSLPSGASVPLASNTVQVVNDPLTPATSVQPASNTVQVVNNQTSDQDVVASDSLESSSPGDQANASVDEQTTGPEVANLTEDSATDSSVDTSSSVVALTDTDTNSTVAAGTYPNSVCVSPGATSVSFESFQRPRVSNPLGSYVPFPASGFGWDGTQLCDLEGSSGLDEIEVLVPYVAKRPDTDGVIANGEWTKAVNASTLNYETLGNDVDNLLLSPVPGYLDGAGYSEWWAMHDGTNLYLRIRVSNDGFSPVVNDSVDFWHDDSIEIFIDGDNSKGLSYDGVNDFQALLRTDNKALPFISENSAPGMQIFHRTGDKFVAYDIEVAINLESLGIEVGKPFGFDLHINEDDNGGDRDAKWGWFEKAGFDRSWYQPSVFGTLMLTDCEDRNSCGSYQTLQP